MLKKWRKRLLLICLTLLTLVGIGVAYTIFSPQPVVWLLRKNFGGEPELINVSNYETIKERVIIHKDLTYPSTDARNQYDIYLPKDRSDQLPTIIWVHGGAFVAGSKDGIENYAVMLADQGYAVVALDYEWAPEIAYPGQVRQVQEGIKELYHVAEQYQLDMDNIILFGDSAGAHIAAQAAVLATNDTYQKELGVTSNLTAQQLKGVVLYCGPYNVERMLDTGNAKLDFFSSRIGWALFGDKDWKDSELLKTTTIKDYVTEQFPKTFISDGNTGSFESQGRELVETLMAKGVQTTSLFFDKETDGDVPHEYQFNIGDNAAGSLCYDLTLTFLEGLDIAVIHP